MNDKESEDIYVVVNEGVAIYASKDEGNAENYAYKKEVLDRDSALEQMGIADDPTKGELAQAGYLAGIESGIYEVYNVNLSKYKKDAEITLGSSEVGYNDILFQLSREEEKKAKLESKLLSQDMY